MSRFFTTNYKLLEDHKKTTLLFDSECSNADRYLNISGTPNLNENVQIVESNLVWFGQASGDGLK